VRFYPGADGMKTGYTSEAKFCLSATAKRDGLRVVAVVLGEPNTKTRNAEVTQLFDYAFSQYMNYPIYKTGDSLGSFHVSKGDVREVQLVAKHPYSLLLKKGEASQGIRHEVQFDPNVKAPIAYGQTVGKLVIYKGNTAIAEYALESPVEVRKAGWWKLFKRSVGSMFN
jgi:D-alanyl-D-alanine carboxypeptidase (penicillin-binding protein 5/6)